MSEEEALQIIKKLQFKDNGQPVLILNAPKSYDIIKAVFVGDVHQEAINEIYDFVQVFGTSNEELQTNARIGLKKLQVNGLLWLCYPKKTSKTYKESDCSRDRVAGLLSIEGFEPVRQIAIDEDWSALRFKKTENIKTMTRKFAVTDKGKERTQVE
ncbi:DUF3052 domain-containing protein [Litchfieldia salsa]|uniref:DUF3052 domain-containing protein n=1 Tax=Litchfieldia salsa TaxID=930152 RepID=A0A1H0T9F4_9BACI|nr:DUF3052 domain-containing protein [Litchfieldia salsa]SDP50485.1 hypothetical protein SAMN05216565_103354 [Litchfieldia salsa]